MSASEGTTYRGRLAPTPTGYLHLGHARTFWTAAERTKAAGGVLVLRDENLDPLRCRDDYSQAMLEDLRWFGFEWQEGPDVGGPLGPYTQRERLPQYLETLTKLSAAGVIYPSPHSRSDIAKALLAPHDPPSGSAAAKEAIFPPSLRPASPLPDGAPVSRDVNWRFRVPDGEVISFDDERCGRVAHTAGEDFGDFLVWRKDGFPAYELAVVHDDHAMQISEVVRGEDLLTSTARQLLIYRALGWDAPVFYHCPLMVDEHGERLAKRTDAVSLRSLRAAGHTPEALRAGW